MTGILPLEPVDKSQHFLHFITDDVPAKFEGLPIHPFAVRLVGHSDGGVARPGGLAADDYGNDNLHTLLSQTSGKLAFGRGSFRQSRQLLRGLVSVWNSDHACDRRRFWLKQ